MTCTCMSHDTHVHMQNLKVRLTRMEMPFWTMMFTTSMNISDKKQIFFFKSWFCKVLESPIFQSSQYLPCLQVVNELLSNCCHSVVQHAGLPQGGGESVVCIVTCMGEGMDGGNTSRYMEGKMTVQWSLHTVDVFGQSREVFAKLEPSNVDANNWCGKCKISFVGSTGRVRQRDLRPWKEFFVEERFHCTCDPWLTELWSHVPYKLTLQKKIVFVSGT